MHKCLQQSTWIHLVPYNWHMHAHYARTGRYYCITRTYVHAYVPGVVKHPSDEMFVVIFVLLH